MWNNVDENCGNGSPIMSRVANLGINFGALITICLVDSLSI